MRTVVSVGLIALPIACGSSGNLGAADAGEGGHDSAGGGRHHDSASPGPEAGTDSSSDAPSSDGDGVMGAAAFVGTWARTIVVTITCPGMTTPDMQLIKTDIVITLGTAPDTIVGTQTGGCSTTYTVSGNVASSMVGMDVCTDIIGPYGCGTLTQAKHTFTLSSDGKTIAQAAQGTLTQPFDGGTVDCDDVATGTFIKK